HVCFSFFFQAEDGIRDFHVTGVQTCALPISAGFSAANYGVLDDTGLLPWTAKKLDELGVKNPNIFQDTDGLDFEAISDSNPDVRSEERRVGKECRGWV